jgi:WD40 repeat protein
MGVVYRARSAKGEEVAIKVLLRLDADGLARFERERRLLGEFTARDGFVPLLDSGVAAEGPYLVMPLLRHGTLRTRLHRGALGVAETLELGRSLGRALAKAHARGIVHRDLKPENILFDDRGEPLVADLGLAKHYDRAAPGASRSVSLSQAGNALGTIFYAAPELLSDAKAAGPPADVFAVGAILYECLAGSVPYPGSTVLEIASRAAKGDFEPLANAAPATPAWLARIVEGALAPVADARPADGSALLGALERGPTRARRAWIPVGLGVVAVLATAGVLLATGPPAPPAVQAPPPAAPVVETVPEVDHTPRVDGPIKLVSTHGDYTWRAIGGVIALALLPDGKHAVSGDGTGTVRIWDLATGHEIRVIPAAKPGFVSLAVSPDGRELVAGTQGALGVFDIATGRMRLVLRGKNDDRVFSVAWSPSGRRILTASGSGGAYASGNGGAHAYHLWDATSGDQVCPMTGETGIPRGIVFLDEHRALSASWGKHLYLWDLDAGRIARQVSLDEANALVVTGNRKRAFVASRFGALSSVDLETDAVHKLYEIDGVDSMLGLSVAKDESRIATIGYTGALEVRDDEGRALWHEETVFGRACVLSADGKRLLTGHEDGFLRSWDVDARREVSKQGGPGGQVTSLDRSGRVAVSNAMGTFEIRDPIGGGPTRRIENQGWWVGRAALAPDGSRLVITRHFTGKTSEIHVYDTKTGDQVRELAIPELTNSLGIDAVAFAPDGATFAAADPTGRLRFFETDTLRPTKDFQCIAGLSNIALFQKGDAWIGSSNQLIYMTPDGAELVPDKPKGSHDDRVTALAGNDRCALSGDARGNVKLWQLNRELARDLPPHAGAITALALSSDEKLAATASNDGTIKIVPLSPGPTAKIGLVGGDHATALTFDGSSKLHVGTARGIVMTFEVKR